MKNDKGEKIKTGKILVATAVAGLVLTGCAEFKLPELPKISKTDTKKDVTEEECRQMRKKLAQMGPSQERNWFAIEVQQCETRYGGVDLDLDKIMEINK